MYAHDTAAAAIGKVNSPTLPDRVRRVLAGLPFKGIHRWLFHAACVCTEETGLDDLQIIDLLHTATRGARRRVSRREIMSALADARRKCGRYAGRPPAAVFTKSWPDMDRSAIAAITKNGPMLVDLWESSPVRFDDDVSHTEEVVDALFPGEQAPPGEGYIRKGKAFVRVSNVQQQ